MDPELGHLIEELQRIRDQVGIAHLRQPRRIRDTLADACNALRAADGLVTKHPRVEDWVTTEWAKQHPAEDPAYIELGTLAPGKNGGL